MQLWHGDYSLFYVAYLNNSYLNENLKYWLKY